MDVKRKAVSRIVLILLLMSILTPAFNIHPAKSEPRTWTVDDDGLADFHTIQEAINAANHRDIILILSGTYYEHVVINKTVSLIGENKTYTFIDGRGIGTVVLVTSDNVTINGFTIRNSGYDVYDAGIWLTSNGNIISKNIVSDNSWGICIDQATTNIVRDNNISGLWHSYMNGSWGGGIYLRGSNGNNISNNIISCHEDNGIFGGGNSNYIIGNTFTNQTHSCMAMSGNNNVIFHNNFIETEGGYLAFVHGINIWDNGYPSGGNYWSDYTYVDEFSGLNQDLPGSDCIGDTPYVIDENNIDRYPLMKPWTPSLIAIYDRLSAYNYAQKYWDEVCSDGYFWDTPSTTISLVVGTDITGMTGYDCAHFVSCCIGNEPNEQGGGLFVPSRVPPTYGEPGAARLGDWLINSSNSVEKTSISELEIGDVINYDWDGDGDWDHIAFYVGNNKVAAHTKCVWKADWQLGGAKKYRFIHIITQAHATWTVDDDGPADFNTIQKAINAANVGDVIIVRDGTYTENVDVNKTHLTIKSENGAEVTIVQAANSEDHVFEVTADYVSIFGFLIKDATGTYYSGVNIEAINCKIFNNIISNNCLGIHLQESSNTAITNNKALNNWHGIIMHHSFNNIISNNFCINNLFCGIYLGNSLTNIIITNEIYENNLYGIKLEYSSNYNEIVKNNFIGCGLIVHYSYNNIVKNNIVNGKPLVYLENVECKEITNAGQVVLIKCKYITVKNCDLSYASIGLELCQSCNCRIENNICMNENYAGIFLRESSNDNIIINNLCGNNKRDDNIIRPGIRIDVSKNNRILNNRIFKCNYGLSLRICSNNFIYLNNFIENINNIYTYDETYTWNSPEKITYNYNGKTYTNYLGNYWSDYTGSEANRDGIGDTSYIINQDNKDNYPLMEPFENYIHVPEKWSFAIITDLHIGRGFDDYGGKGIGIPDREGAGQNYYLTERLNNTVKWINDNHNKPEYNIKFVAVLGDISDSGEYSELKKAKDILDDLNVPYIPVIGNHDIWPYTKSEEFQRIRYFEAVFREQYEKLETDPSFNLQNQTNPNPSDLQNYAFSYKGWNFIILDFVSRTAVPVQEKGVLGSAVLWEDTLGWLIDNLQEDKPTILLSHHPMIAMHPSAFLNPFDIEALSKAIRNFNVQVNFAGHIHGYYDENKDFIVGFPEQLCNNPYFMDANKNYAEDILFTTPADIDVVTTEALMVASNVPESRNTVRIVKIDGNEPNYDTIDCECRALNPYFKIMDINPTYFISSEGIVSQTGFKVNFEAYAFTKRSTKENPVNYTWNFEDSDETYVTYPEDPLIWKYYYGRSYKTHRYDLELGIQPGTMLSYDVNLNVSLYTPDGNDIIYEDITKELNYTVKLLLTGVTRSPVDIVVTDPDGYILSKEINEISGASYFEIDFDEDGELNDIFVVPGPKDGEYQITVIPETGADPNDIYSLEIWRDDFSIVIADKVPISDIPDQPYLIELTEHTINAAPIAEAGGPCSGYEGSLITFDASGSYDPDGTIVSYEWDFNGDEEYDSISPSPIATFSWGDDYFGTVTLRVTDDEGLSCIDTAEVTVDNVVSIVKAGADQTVYEGDPVTFSGSFEDPGKLDTHTFVWNFGDGDSASSTLTPTHVYTQSGTYPVTLTVTDDGGAGSDILTVIVKGPKRFKEDVVGRLEDIETGDRKVDRALNGVIHLVDKSLDDKYWVDEDHLKVEKHGRRGWKYTGGAVFTYEGLAVGDMVLHIKLWEKRGPTSEQQQAIATFEEVIPYLVNADELLAKTALDEAHSVSPIDPAKQKAYQVALNKADTAFERAQRLSENRPALAILFYKHAWKYAQLAIKLAQ